MTRQSLYSKFDKWLSYIIIGLFFLAAGSLFSILLFDELEWALPTSKNWSNLLSVFDFPLKVLAGTIVLITIKVTIKRIIQTEDTLDIMYKNLKVTRDNLDNSINNNKLNNYFLFKEKFESYFLDSKSFKLLKANFELSEKTLLNRIFSDFICRDYSEFQPDMPDRTKNNIKDFIQLIEQTKKTSRMALFNTFNNGEFKFDTTINKYEGYLIDELAENQFGDSMKNSRLEQFGSTKNNLRNENLRLAIYLYDRFTFFLDISQFYVKNEFTKNLEDTSLLEGINLFYDHLHREVGLQTVKLVGK